MQVNQVQLEDKHQVQRKNNMLGSQSLKRPRRIQATRLQTGAQAGHSRGDDGTVCPPAFEASPRKALPSHLVRAAKRTRRDSSAARRSPANSTLWSPSPRTALPQATLGAVSFLAARAESGSLETKRAGLEGQRAKWRGTKLTFWFWCVGGERRGGG